MENKNITVKQLIKKLEKYSSDMEVWIVNEVSKGNTKHDDLIIKKYYNEWIQDDCVGIKPKNGLC